MKFSLSCIKYLLNTPYEFHQSIQNLCCEFCFRKLVFLYFLHVKFWDTNQRDLFTTFDLNISSLKKALNRTYGDCHIGESFLNVLIASSKKILKNTFLALFKDKKSCKNINLMAFAWEIFDTPSYYQKHRKEFSYDWDTKKYIQCIQ